MAPSDSISQIDKELLERVDFIADQTRVFGDKLREAKQALAIPGHSFSLLPAPMSGLA